MGTARAWQQQRRDEAGRRMPRDIVERRGQGEGLQGAGGLQSRQKPRRERSSLISECWGEDWRCSLQETSSLRRPLPSLLCLPCYPIPAPLASAVAIAAAHPTASLPPRLAAVRRHSPFGV